MIMPTVHELESRLATAERAEIDSFHRANRLAISAAVAYSRLCAENHAPSRDLLREAWAAARREHAAASADHAQATNLRLLAAQALRLARIDQKGGDGP
jgi:hypothetical protein